MRMTWWFLYKLITLFQWEKTSLLLQLLITLFPNPILSQNRSASKILKQEGLYCMINRRNNNSLSLSCYEGRSNWQNWTAKIKRVLKYWVPFLLAGCCKYHSRPSLRLRLVVCLDIGMGNLPSPKLSTTKETNSLSTHYFLKYFFLWYWYALFYYTI